MLLTVLQHPDPRLRIKARPVEAFTPRHQELADDLFETMYAAKAIGLAASQVDVHEQLVVLDVSEGRDQPELFVNAQVLERSTPGLVEESCLSLPGVVASVQRPTVIRIRAMAKDGSWYERSLEGLLAVCLQHELDHLEGRLFIDRLPFFERLRVRRRLRSHLAGAGA
jgi:peptide deformylase